jgi:hypothetical protein
MSCYFLQIEENWIPRRILTKNLWDIKAYVSKKMCGVHHGHSSLSPTKQMAAQIKMATMFPGNSIQIRKSDIYILICE